MPTVILASQEFDPTSPTNINHSQEGPSSSSDISQRLADGTQQQQQQQRSPPPPLKKQLGEAVIVVRNLKKSYAIAGRPERVQALKEITLSDDMHEDGSEPEFYAIRRGEFVILRGPSGGGKTTLLNMIGAIDSPTSGVVELLGERITTKSSDEYLSDLRLRKIGFVFQTFNLLATMSAFENVELPMIILGKLNASQRRERTMKLLQLVGLQDRVSHLPSELSGGEQQRVAIARSLANEVEILIMDEPTGDLDTFNTVEVMNLLLKINREERTTILMVTHNPDIECYADRLLYLQDGQLHRQAINSEQVQLDFERYSEYLKQKEQ